MGRTKYWTGSIDSVWHAGLGRFLARGDEADADDVKGDDRWSAQHPDGIPEKKEDNHADEPAQNEK